MVVGVQFTGSVPGSSSRRWFTFNWPANWDVVWTVVSTSPLSVRRRSSGMLQWSEPLRLRLPTGLRSRT